MPVVMQIVPELGAGGAEQGCIDVAEALVRAGHRSLVVSNGGMRVPEITHHGSEHISLPVHSKNPVILWRNVSRLKSLIRRHKVDIVHARSRAPAWSAWKACQETGTRFVTTCHAPYGISGKYKKMYNGSIAKGERVIAISDYVAEYLDKNYEIEPARIRVIPRGVSLDRFRPDTVSGERLAAIAKEWRLPDSVNVVFMPGRLTRWKGQAVLIEAMALLERHPDLFCVMSGDAQGRDEYVKELEALVEAKNLGGRVRISGHCTDMPAAYTLASVVVSASTEPEGFGRVPVEAQAMGRPVIATDHGGAKETILPGHTGWLIPPNDSKALAEMIDGVMDLDEDQRAYLSSNASAHVAMNFSKEKMTAQTLAVYDELLAESSSANRVVAA